MNSHGGPWELEIFALVPMIEVGKKEKGVKSILQKRKKEKGVKSILQKRKGDKSILQQ